MNGLPPAVIATFAGVLGLLIVASIAWRALRKLRPDRDHFELAARVKTWWVMATVFALALLLGHTLSLVFFAFLSFLALKEYLSLIPTRRADRRVLFWAYLAIPFQYLWIGDAWYGMFIVFIPVYVFLFLPIRMILIGETEGFLRAVGTLQWGMMITVFVPSHAAYLLFLELPSDPALRIGPALVLFLVLVTQCNDVAQYVWGKSLGRRKVAPKVSPGKTWAGFLGGVGTYMLLAVLLAPWLTPLSSGPALAAGAIIGVGGFCGDLIISALKRDLGVKDMGSTLPGHGGVLDRIDSLTCTAPLFFHFVYWVAF
jgi:phosphatidate cytidylyltransferase